ncbi:MAG: TolC family protein [Opitutus sp.]|nr:TolC family protein [Opitutus sp.]
MSRHLTRAFLSFFFCFAALAALRAQALVPGAPLTLEECIARAMKKNFDLQIQGYSTDIAKENLNIAKSDFEPTLTASANRGLNQAASTTSTLDGTALVGPRADSTSATVGISQRLPQTGATLGLSTNLSRSATNSRFSTLNPAYASGVTATVSQPLLKGAGRAVVTANIESNKIGVSIAVLNYRSRVLTVIRDTETAYHNLVSARETLRIRQLSLELAQRLFDENQARRNTGVATDLDVLTAEVGVANARRAVIQAEQTVRNNEDNLLALSTPDNFDTRPGPVTFPDYNESPPDFASSYKLVRDNYPDYLSTASVIRQLEISLATAKQNKLPTLNLNGSLGYNNTDHSYGDAISNLPDHHGNNWGLGLVYTMPWGMKADLARFRSSTASLSSQKTRLRQLEQTLLVQVRADVRAVETNLASVSIAAQATKLSEKQYEQQKARFDAGLSTSRLVLQAQDDLEAARVNELTTKVALRNAVAELHRLDGTSLQRFRIALPE